MATATDTAPKTRKPPATPRGTCRLTLTINGTGYGVKPLPCPPEAARQCFELRKGDGTTYHVSRHDHGAECTCGDFVYHRDGIDEQGCKHIRSLVAVGLLDTRPARVQVPPPSAWDGDEWDDSVRYTITR